MTTSAPLTADILIDMLKKLEVDADAGTPFDTLDLDSLRLAELAVMLTQRYGIDVTDDELALAGSINGTLQLLDTKTGDRRPG